MQQCNNSTMQQRMQKSAGTNQIISVLQFCNILESKAGVDELLVFLSTIGVGQARGNTYVLFLLLLVCRTQSIDDEDDDDEGAGKAASFRVMNKVCIKNVI